jgi:hypothetical protein
MFVGDEVQLDVSFAVARERLLRLAEGGLFPVLDADLTLAPAREQGSVLSMAGVYRPPLGALGQALDRAVLRRVAVATIRRFVAQVAASIDGGV